MIGNLAETTRKNTDQDWLKTNIAKLPACYKASATC